MHQFAHIRKHLGLSQRELANALGCSRSHIAMIKKGKRMPDLLISNKIKALMTNEAFTVNKTCIQTFVTFKQKKDFELMRRQQANILDTTSIKLIAANRKLHQLTSISDELQVKLKYVTGIDHKATKLKYRRTIEQLEKLSESTMHLYFKQKTTIALIKEIDAMITSFDLPEAGEGTLVMEE